MARPKGSISLKWDEKNLFHIRVSLNDIKFLLVKFKNHRTNERGGKICKKLLKALRSKLETDLKNGVLPPAIADVLIKGSKDLEDPERLQYDVEELDDVDANLLAQDNSEIVNYDEDVLDNEVKEDKKDEESDSEDNDDLEDEEED